MSQEYGPRGILLLLELGPIMSAVLTSASATDAPFGKSKMHRKLILGCPVHSWSLQQAEINPGKQQAGLCLSGEGKDVATVMRRNCNN